MEATKNAGTLDGIFFEAAEPEEREDLQDLRELKLAGIPLVEQETAINYRRSEDGAEIWTSDRTVMTKLDRMCQEAPENYQCTETGRALNSDAVMCKVYSISDKSLISFRARRVKLELTDEQKRERAERMRRLQNAF